MLSKDLENYIEAKVNNEKKYRWYGVQVELKSKAINIIKKVSFRKGR